MEGKLELSAPPPYLPSPKQKSQPRGREGLSSQTIMSWPILLRDSAITGQHLVLVYLLKKVLVDAYPVLRVRFLEQMVVNSFERS